LLTDRSLKRIRYHYRKVQTSLRFSRYEALCLEWLLLLLHRHVKISPPVDLKNLSQIGNNGRSEDIFYVSSAETLEVF
jgi:hypothetical protein